MLEKSVLLSAEKNPIPCGVGVYLFLNKKKEVLYIGKSKNIRTRIFSYFKGASIKEEKIISSFFYVDFVLVESEKDALLLENTFIKKHQPKYNILLKDDKNYPWLCVTKDRFPRLFITRKKNISSCFYFGPYISKKQLNHLYNFILKNYPIRSCKYNLSEKNILEKKYSVCLDYHLKKCLGPCEGFQSEKNYNENINSIKNILSGKYGFVLRDLQKKMKFFSKKLEFEKADVIKNQIISLNILKKRSSVVSEKNINLDCFYVLLYKNIFYVNFLRVSEGSIIFLKNNKIKNPVFFDSFFVLKSYIKSVFFNYGYLSKVVISNIDLGVFLNKKIIVPKMGFNKSILNFSYNNLSSFVNINNDSNYSVLQNLKNDLYLKKIPFHIECFDVSTLLGSNTVSSCVVFKNGKPSKKDYTFFNIKSFSGIDDYLSIKESVKRRYINKKTYPDLIVIDGGKGHLNSVLSVLKKLNLGFLDVISIAKKNETLFLKNNKTLFFKKKSESLKLIQFLRDEAHRFCLKNHRKKRNSSFLISDFNNISGVGKKSFLKLIKKFRTIDKIKYLSKNDLVFILGKKRGVLVFDYFNNNC